MTSESDSGAERLFRILSERVSPPPLPRPLRLGGWGPAVALGAAGALWARGLFPFRFNCPPCRAMTTGYMHDEALVDLRTPWRRFLDMFKG